jgi:hypothetical protein
MAVKVICNYCGALFGRYWNLHSEFFDLLSLFPKNKVGLYDYHSVYPLIKLSNALTSLY